MVCNKRKYELPGSSCFTHARCFCLILLAVFTVQFLPLNGANARPYKKAGAEILDIASNPKYASLVVNATTGEILHKYNAEQQRHPASLTKMMTIYLALQSIKMHKFNMNSAIRISKKAASQSPSKMWLKPGQSITMRDAIYALIVRSANDVAVAVAEAISGSESAFAYLMTDTAHKLGMKNTTFQNASGLHHEEQVTTAYDMAKLGIALRRDFPEYYHMFSKRSFIYKGAVINGHNRVVERYKGADGLKTGYIVASGYNLVTSAKRPEGSIIGVVLGGQTAPARDAHMVALLDGGFAKLGVGRSVASASLEVVHEQADPFMIAEQDIEGWHEQTIAQIQSAVIEKRSPSVKVRSASKSKRKIAKNAARHKVLRNNKKTKRV